MALSKRIIGRLDIKNSNLVKGIHLEGLRVLGDPSYFSNKYYDHHIDEIHFQDVVASLYNRNQLESVISSTVKNIFVPINVGGGIRSIEDIDTILKLGADKVTINSAGVRNPSFISEAVEIYGSSTITVAIEAIKKQNIYEVLIESGRENTYLDVFEWIDKVQELGAGEICLTSIDREGTKKGFDIQLYKLAKRNLNIPLVAHGGAGSIENIIQIFVEADVDAVSIASFLHYSYLPNKKIIPNAGNTNFLKNINSQKKEENLIEDIKHILKSNGVHVR